jgi:hypothetical protein
VALESSSPRRALTSNSGLLVDPQKGLSQYKEVAGAQLTPADARVIHHGSVRRVEIVNDPLVIAGDQARVAARNAWFVDHDVAVMVAPDDQF